MESVFSELSLVIVVTAIVSIFMMLIRQPLILGYILAGLLVGPSAFGLIHNTELFEAFSAIGIALLLFIIGLGMNVGELSKLGRVVFTIALTSFATITSAGFVVGSMLGFSKTEAIITGLALFFSSTIIIVKLLSDKKEQNRLHGQIAIGVILVEDLVATLALLYLVAGKGGGVEVSQFIILFAKSIFLAIFLYLCSTKVLPRVSRYMAATQEMLFLFAISWGFGIATLFEKAGFSIEIGALFAGVALASSPYVQEIAARLKPLRDFFIVLFFITLGERMDIGSLGSAIGPALILSAVVILLKPFIVTFTTGLMGYTKRVSFKTGINLSQISEFSIILVLLAVNAEMVRPELGSIITLVAIITIAVSTYLMQYDDRLFTYFDRIKLHMFEKEVSYKERRGPKAYQYIILGYHHGGHEFIKTFQDMKKRFLVIDYDPEVIDILENQKIDYLYGDATDMELLREAGIDRCKLVVSTIVGHDANLFVAASLKELNPKAIYISHADNIAQATQLYDAGATYVMIPHHIGSEKMSAFIRRTGEDKEQFQKHREKHIASLEARLGNTLEQV